MEVQRPAQARLTSAALALSLLLTAFAATAGAAPGCTAVALPCRTVWTAEFTDVAPVYGHGDFNGDGADDLLLLRNGALWFSYGSTSQVPTVVAMSAVRVMRAGEMQRAIAGTEPVIGDFDGDGRDDVLWATATGAAVDNGQIWFGTAEIGAFRGAPAAWTQHDPSAFWSVGDFDGDGGDDVLWYRESTGELLLQLLDGDQQGLQARPFPDRLTARLRVLPGDFDGNGTTDVLYYDPRTGHASAWFFLAGGAIVGRDLDHGAGYRPVVGDFDGDGRDDVLWHGPGALVDAYWFGAPEGAFRGAPLEVGEGSWFPVAADFDGDGRDDVLWWDGGPGPDVLTLTRTGGGYGIGVEIGAVSQITLADVDGDGAADPLFSGVYDAENRPTTWALWWLSGPSAS